jgi:hypothetical protein
LRCCGSYIEECPPARCIFRQTPPKNVLGAINGCRLCTRAILLLSHVYDKITDDLPLGISLFSLLLGWRARPCRKRDFTPIFGFSLSISTTADAAG